MTTKQLTTSRLHRRRKIVPYIRLSGDWLHVAGIAPGSPITVTVTPQGITIRSYPPRNGGDPLGATGAKP